MIEGSDEFKELHRKISNLEHHLINLIVPIQGLSKLFSSSDLAERLVKTFSKPIQIDDRALKKYLDDFYEKMTKFAADKDLSQAFSEIKYIVNRLKVIEETLQQLKTEGLKKTLDIALTFDGFDMFKKPKNYEETCAKVQVEDPFPDIKNLLDTITPREALTVMHRLGLMGEKAKTYEGVGDILKVNRERARQIFAKAIRKFRQPARRELVEKVKHERLRKEVGF